MKRFRAARPDDNDAILALMRVYYEEDGYPFDEDVARATLTALVTQPALGAVWVATPAEDGAVVGYIAVALGFSLEFGGRDAFIDEICMRDDWRGQGLGKEGVEIALDYCRANDVRAVHLEVERHRTPARRLYERLGFENHDRELLTRKL